MQAGQKFYYGYMENGHVTKDQAGRRTQYGVYWTGQADSSLGTTLNMTQDRLIDGKMHNFDDGHCGESFEDAEGTIPSGRAGNGLPCVGETAIPAGSKPGIYHLVWFWKFYDEKSESGKLTAKRGDNVGGDAYTACFEVEVVGEGADIGERNTTSTANVTSTARNSSSNPSVRGPR